MRIMQVDAVGGVLCALLLWVGQGNLWLTWAGVIGVGLSLASLFPTMLAYAETRLPMTGKVTSGIMHGLGQHRRDYHAVGGRAGFY